MQSTQEVTMADLKKGVHGEGNYEAAREYDKGVEEFVDSGKVEEAARKAKPRTQQEAREMEQAEQEGLKHAKDKQQPK
jgi:hypothetical protein